MAAGFASLFVVFVCCYLMYMLSLHINIMRINCFLTYFNTNLAFNKARYVSCLHFVFLLTKPRHSRQVESDYCLLLALPCGRDQEDVLGQTQALKSAFITYLQAKQAAGIINVPNPGSNQVRAHRWPLSNATEVTELTMSS